MHGENVQRYDVEYARVGGCENHRCRHSGLVGLEPPQRHHAPAIARHETRKVVLGSRSDEVVADRLLVREELRGYDGADRVAADVLGTTRAAAVAIEPGDG